MLVLVFMIFIGVFIVNRLESTQLEAVREEMTQTVNTIISSSDLIVEKDWLRSSEDIQKMLDEWRINSNFQLYLIYDDNIPTIIASTTNNAKSIKGKKALSYKDFNPDIIISAFKGTAGENNVEDKNMNAKSIHMTKPIVDNSGNIRGIFYLIGDLQGVYNLIDSTRAIMTNASLVALLITVILGYVLASSITGPISDVTKKAREMAKGDFDQKVDVKSDDEIGQLGTMFNYLTEELKHTISDMDLERAKLDTIFNYMAEGVVAVNKENKLIHANYIATDLLGLTDEELLGLKTFNISRIGIENIDYSDIRTLEGEVSESMDDKFFNIKYAPYLDDNSQPSGIIAVFQDITKEHKLDDMRKEFVANVSHELKTPITTIKTYSETLIDQDLDRDTNKHFLEIINKESDRMNNLVMDLLQLSNIDYKHTNWEIEALDISKILEQCLQSLDLMRKEKEIYVATNFKKTYVKADRNALDKIFMNVISNAYKYTGNRGRVDIVVTEFRRDVNITIKDNGIGIPFKDQRRIFERFYRVEKGRSREEGGTGLGLSISKELIDALDGKIMLDSAPGRGTEITITLPRAKAGDKI